MNILSMRVWRRVRIVTGVTLIPSNSNASLCLAQTSATVLVFSISDSFSTQRIRRDPIRPLRRMSNEIDGPRHPIK